MITVTGYQLAERLHEGRNSNVYRARRVSDGASVVLKVLSADVPTADVLARLRHEHSVLQALADVQGVVRTLGIETVGMWGALVLEDFGARSLQAWRREGPRTLDERLAVAIECAAVLGRVHERHVLHKDVNPTNFLYNAETGALKIADLGIATVLSREMPEARSPGEIEGTLAYLAPEQTGRMNRPLDHRADLYALGATLYELFTGAPPFTGGDALEVVHCHMARRPTPPSERDATVPKALSDVILRLLAKTAEERYQGAEGVRRDLEEIRAGVANGDDLAGFVPARHDVAERFEVPHRIYGRDAELDALLRAFSAVAEAARPALVLVRGAAGIGKSVLAHELYKPITARRGYFIEGKYDQLLRATPYSALVAAFRSLVRQLLGEPEGALATWRERLREALGVNGRLIADVVPEVELILGAQPPVAEVGPAEAQHRFNVVFQSFVRVFARPEHPLAIFLDDLQWADGASLKLLDLLLSDDRPQSLLLVGAYRDNEVPAAHPLALTLDAIRQRDVPCASIALAPLGIDAVARMVADAVDRPVAEVAPLAALVAARTEGNPLFIGELLKALYQDGLLSLDRGLNRWRWDVAAIASHGLTDNVVGLVVSKLRRLPEATLRLVKLAACVGNRFDLDTLSVVAEAPAVEVYRALVPALQEGFVVATSAMASADDAGSAMVARAFRFFHDRVQQAAYALIDDAEREALHLGIGRLLRDGAAGGDPSARAFAVADHLGRGRRLIADDAGRLDLARVSLEAGRRARASLAYDAARDYLAVALDALPADAWESAYDVTRDVHVEAADVACLLAAYDRAEALSMTLLARVRSDVERIQVYTQLIEQYTLSARYDDAMAASTTGAALAGIPLSLAISPEAAMAAFGGAVQDASAALGDRSIDSLAEAPEIADPLAGVALTLLQRSVGATYFKSPLLWAQVVCRAVQLMLRHGASRRSCDMYGNYGVLLAGLLGAPAAGYAFGRLALRQAERFRAPDAQCRSAFFLASFIGPWTRPLRESVALNERGYRAGVEGGDITYQGWLLIWMAFTPFYLGAPLDEVAATIVDHLRFNRRTRNHIATDVLEGAELAVSNLREVTGEPEDFRVGTETESERVEAWRARGSSMALALYPILKAEALYLHDRPRAALDVLTASEALLAAVPGNFATAYHPLFTGLAASALLTDAVDDTRAGLRARLDASLARVARFAADCPDNYEHLRLLLAAEAARVDGRPAEAEGLYEEAIEGARAAGFPQHAAMACERAGEHLHARGRGRAAWGYLTEALAGYVARGAARKVALMRRRHPELRGRAEAAGATVATGTHELAGTTDRGGGTLDVGSLLKASHAISGEIELGRLLVTLMGALVENAGAQRGALLTSDDGELRVRVTARAGDDGVPAIEVTAPTTASEFADLCEEAVRYAARTRETVLLGDASREGAFTQTAYVRSRGTRSMLCVPLVRQGALVGVLYLENDLAAGAFTASRAEFLRAISSQAAISLENARLFDSLQARNRDLARAHESTRRFVPEEYLRLLGHKAITDVSRGDHTALDLAVLFSDIRGFTTLAERLGAGGTYSFINEYLAAMVPEIHGHAGLINQYHGDGVMALFPATPDDAVLAAVGMIRALERLNDSLRTRGWDRLRIGVGINAGPVMLGTIGGGDHLACTVMGDAVNLASRVEGITKMYGVRVLVTDAVVSRLREPGRFALRAVARVVAKGRTQPVTVFEVLDAEPPATRDRRLAAVPVFEQAFALYAAGAFHEAGRVFAELAAADPDDGAVQVYVSQCETLARAGAPEGWSGVVRLESK